MKISWLGTASLTITNGSRKILVDPYLRPNKHLPPITKKDFAGADAIIITHGHIDHLSDVPEIMREYENLTVYCTKTPAKTLMHFGIPQERINVISAGETFCFGNYTIRVFASKHVHFNPGFVALTVPRCAAMLPKAFMFAMGATHFPEAHETVMYEIENDGKRVLISGSFGTVENVSYPESPDLFVFPFNGSTAVHTAGVEFMKNIQPKKVMISHHDNSFPPLTMKMNTGKLTQEINAVFPGLPVIDPVEKKEYEI